MTFVVVIARQNSGKPNRIYKGANIMQILRKIKKDHAARYHIPWNDEMDEYIRQNNGLKPRSAMAIEMSRMFDEPITKNALTRRCMNLGLINARKTT